MSMPPCPSRSQLAAVAATVIALSTAAHAQGQPKQVTIEVTKLGGSLHLLRAVGGFGGGNVIASVGPDGVLLVDTQLARMTPKLADALRALSSQPVRYIVTTHPHTDHVGGHAELGAAATIIGHTRARAAMADPAQKLPAGAVPRLTIEDRLTLHFNDEEIEVVHPRTAHTDADLFVFFKKAQIVHLGDEYFFGMFPQLDDNGDWTGLVQNLDKLVTELPPGTRIVPGHGQVATLKDLRETVAMMKDTAAIVRAGIAAGKSLAQLKKERVLARYDAWGRGYISTDQYLEMLYPLMQKTPRS